MALAPRAPIGQRLKAGRRDKALTQRVLAEEIGISVSYLNLIENNKRVIGGTLLRDLARRLDLDLDTLTGTRETRLIGQLHDVLSDPFVRSVPTGEGYLADFVGRFPDLAELLQRLYEQWQARLETDELLSERIRSDSSLREIGHQIISHITALRSFSEILSDGEDIDPEQRQRFQGIVASEAAELSTLSRDFFSALSNLEKSGRARSPSDEVSDLFSESNQYFHTLEQEADLWRAEHRTPLAWDDAVDSNDHRASPAVDALLAQARLGDSTAVELARQALLAYRLRALMMPYESFLGAVQDTNLDLDRIAKQFRVPTDQVFERLVSLRQPDQSGPLVAFMRTDLAGNIAASASNAVLNIPRYGGGCPLWAVYRAVLTPGRTTAQRAQMPAGRDLLMIAHTLFPAAASFGAQRPITSVMIALDWKDGQETVFGPQLQSTTPTNIGPTCRFCTRTACQHRFEPSSIGTE